MPCMRVAWHRELSLAAALAHAAAPPAHSECAGSQQQYSFVSPFFRRICIAPFLGMLQCCACLRSTYAMRTIAYARPDARGALQHASVVRSVAFSRLRAHSSAQRMQQRCTAATGFPMALGGLAVAAHALLVWCLVTGTAIAADSALSSSSGVVAQVSEAPALFGRQQVSPARRQQQQLKRQQPVQQQQQQQHAAGQRAPLQMSRPHVIAHRGASGLLPEHTLSAYAAAIEQGADFIECDVEVTADLQLVCRHEPNINDTTNAWQLFRDRATTHVIDGERVSGIFTSDLALAEVQRLRARQPWPFRDQSHNDEATIPTLQAFLELAAAAPRAVGVYPETKHPSWHNSLPALRAANTTIEQLLVAELTAHGYARSSPLGSPAWRAAPVLLQSFEASSLKRLAALTDMPRVLLMGGWPNYTAPDSGLSHEQMTSDAFLAELATYASGAGPWKGSLYRVVDSSSGSTGSGGGSTDLSHPDVGRAAGGAGTQQRVSTGLVARLHAHGLLVHPYTLRDEQRFLIDGCNNAACEYEWLFNDEGVDGAFTDFPGTLAGWMRQQQLDAAAAAGGGSSRAAAAGRAAVHAVHVSLRVKQLPRQMNAFFSLLP